MSVQNRAFHTRDGAAEALSTPAALELLPQCQVDESPHRTPMLWSVFLDMHMCAAIALSTPICAGAAASLAGGLGWSILGSL